jgi:hypothetical protein
MRALEADIPRGRLPVWVVASVPDILDLDEQGLDR